MDKAIEKPKKNLGESIRQRLKNLSEQRNRPFDEILRYYAMERFLYRLSISPYAEKFESIVKLALVNTRMKDFYDLWTILKRHEIEPERLNNAIHKVFTNRKTPLQTPIAFTPAFYDTKETQQRWNNFLSAMGKEPISFKDVISELLEYTHGFFRSEG